MIKRLNCQLSCEKYFVFVWICKHLEMLIRLKFSLACRQLASFNFLQAWPIRIAERPPACIVCATLTSPTIKDRKRKKPKFF